MSAVSEPARPFVAADLRALVFDVFGTVVDWRGSITREGQALAARLGMPGVDWAAFADDWRAGYQPAMARVRRGELPWTSIDGLHRGILDDLLVARGLVLPEAEAAAFNLAWHRLDPWPDTCAGLLRLKARWPVVTLSNGNVALLVDMARHAGLPWDAVFSAELFGHYKPDPEVYLGAARLLAAAPQQALMVAAHPGDLRAAANCGLRTAYVARPLEHGPGGPMEAWTPGEFDVAVDSFTALADALGA
jgi:2-haloacid dehalogenase